MNETTPTCVRASCGLDLASAWTSNVEAKTSRRGAWTSNARAGDATDAEARRARAMCRSDDSRRGQRGWGGGGLCGES